MFLTIFKWVQVLVLIIQTVIYMVERPGDGALKRDEAIDAFLKIVSCVPLPGWVKTLFINKEVIGVLIDLSVWFANKNAVFKQSDVDPADLLNKSGLKDNLIFTGDIKEPIINAADVAN